MFLSCFCCCFWNSSHFCWKSCLCCCLHCLRCCLHCFPFHNSFAICIFLLMQLDLQLCNQQSRFFFITSYIVPKTSKNIQQNHIAFFPIYIIIIIVKRIYPSKIFFLHTPYLIIYTPLETPGSSPTGCFTVYL